jgi:hypothetical protein
MSLNFFKVYVFLFSCLMPLSTSSSTHSVFSCLMPPSRDETYIGTYRWRHDNTLMPPSRTQTYGWKKLREA